jgi:peptidoglycan glycosyltransferase
VSAPTLARHRRNVELTLGLLTIVVTIGGYVLVALANGPELPPDLYVLLGGVFGLYLLAHLTVRRLAPAADGTLLPLAALLNGIGFVTIARIDRELARLQSIWVAVAVGAFIITLILVRDTRVLERYRYTFALLGLLFLLIPLVPGIGREINGARLWLSIGALNFQPGEAAKVLLVVFFAGYLVDKRELLAAGSRKFAGMYLPAIRHLGPLLLAWGFAVVVMVAEKDLGSSLLFFAIFAAMLYMATGRSVYLVVGLVLFVVAALVAYHLFGHVRVRVETWLDPWPKAHDEGLQVTQSWFAFGTGGIAGTGLGLGNPDKIPLAATDFVFSAIGEELGFVGAVGVLTCFVLFVGSALRVAVDATRPFSKLFAAGLATIIGVQTLIIVGGVTRMIPLTGVTLPFVSYGGSSLVANFVLLALLLRISDETMSGSRT